MSDLEWIREKLGDTEVLAQLAEEAAELSQAALKLRRVLDGRNPTPMLERNAVDNLTEEIADVDLCIDILEPTLIQKLWMEPNDLYYALEKIKERKQKRWVLRIRNKVEEEENGRSDQAIDG